MLTTLSRKQKAGSIDRQLALCDANRCLKNEQLRGVNKLRKIFSGPGAAPGGADVGAGTVAAVSEIEALDE